MSRISEKAARKWFRKLGTMQREAAIRMTHASIALEGNSQTLEQVRSVAHNLFWKD